jgi:hypothetical protein
MRGTIHVAGCEKHIEAAKEIRVLVTLFDQGPRFEVIEEWLLLSKEQAFGLLWKKGFDYDYCEIGSDPILWIHPKGKISSVEKPKLTLHGEQVLEDEMENF